MKKNLFQHLVSISATGLACAAILLQNPVPFTPLPNNNWNWHESIGQGSNKQGESSITGNDQGISVQNDEEDITKLPELS